MSATNEDTQPSVVAGQAGMDAGAPTAANEKMLQDSEAAGFTASRSSSGQLSVAADVSEPEFTAVSSGTSSSSQGLQQTSRILLFVTTYTDYVFTSYVRADIRGSNYKLVNDSFHYDLCKHVFSARIVNIWNYLPNWIVDLIPLSHITSHRGHRCRPWQASVSEK